MENMTDNTGEDVVHDGMLTTIPFEEFISLEEQTEYLERPHKFQWEDFVARRDNLELLTMYLDESELKVLGIGSSRTVYAMKKSNVNGYADGPCVLKLACHSQKGPAQNRAEAMILKRYQDKLECFPKLYAYDNKKWYYLLTEVGTPLNTAPPAFVNRQLGRLRKFFREHMKLDEFPADAKTFDEDDFDIKDLDDFVRVISGILSLMSGKCSGCDIELLWFCDMIDNMKKSEDSLVRVIGDVLSYAKRYGNKSVELDDFAQAGNWGFVKRDGQFMLIPIDWGASPEVVRKYYTSESRNVITFSELKELLK